MDVEAAKKARPNLHLPIPPLQWASSSEPSSSPDPKFYSAPSSPAELTLPPSQLAMQQSLSPISDEAFPSPTELPNEFMLDDQGLTAVDKIYLFSRSNAVFHRVYITHALPTFLLDVSPEDAVDYVLPLLNLLATDEDEQVKVALVTELVPTMWWFYSHCQLLPEQEERKEGTASISVQAFTPILGTLLLSPSASVGGPARLAVVEMLQLMVQANEAEAEGDNGSTAVELGMPLGLFGRDERALFENEIIMQLVIGMGRLDLDSDLDTQITITTDHSDSDDSTDNDAFFTPLNFPSPDPTVLPAALLDTVLRDRNYNPYFPVIALNSPSSLSFASSSNSSLSSGSTPASTIGSSASDSSTQSPHPQLDSDILHSSGKSSSAETFSTADVLITVPLRVRPPNEHIHQASDEVRALSPTHRRGSRDLFLTDLGEPALDSPLLRNTPSDPLPPDLPPATQAQYITLITPLTSPRGLHNAEDTSNSMPSTGIPLAIGRMNHVHPPSPDVASAERSTGEDSQLAAGDVSFAETEELNAEQAAVGRLSSMSLMAAVAASGCLSDENKKLCVKEVGRVSHDPLYWVRREACFAVGALAKVVPDEVVALTLLPLLQELLTDPVYHVRQSSLFALPAILSRLSHARRKEVALSSLIPMSMDESAVVRSGVLESMGEVIYTFHREPRVAGSSIVGEEEDEGGGPPMELVEMFLGKQYENDENPMGTDSNVLEDTEMRGPETPLEKDKTKALELFYKDPARPLICAFNFPAVVLVLGQSQWDTVLRLPYLKLAFSPPASVAQTLAASLGAVANIIGQDLAEHDLLDVWSTFIEREETDVRLKVVECLPSFLAALKPQVRKRALETVVRRYAQGGWKGWREREGIAKFLVPILEQCAGVNELVALLGRLVTLVLQDSVSAVREEGVKALPNVWSVLRTHAPIFETLMRDISALSTSRNYRARMTFVACQQSLMFPHNDLPPAVVPDAKLWMQLSTLGCDPVSGVRIGVARVVGIFCTRSAQQGLPIVDALRDLQKHLLIDSSQEVRSYAVTGVASDNEPQKVHSVQTSHRGSYDRRHSASIDTFSRPPGNLMIAAPA